MHSFFHFFSLAQKIQWEGETLLLSAYHPVATFLNNVKRGLVKAPPPRSNDYRSEQLFFPVQLQQSHVYCHSDQRPFFFFSSFNSPSLVQAISILQGSLGQDKLQQSEKVIFIARNEKKNSSISFHPGIWTSRARCCK